jgi:regulator of protease activity HflC (stomatin/prohibitin superfamily)
MIDIELLPRLRGIFPPVNDICLLFVLLTVLALVNELLPESRRQTTRRHAMQERELRLGSGWTMLVVVLLWLVMTLGMFITAIVMATHNAEAVAAVLFVSTVLSGLGWLISLFGFIIVNPNEARVIQLFGKYVGTVKEVGFFYGNPFYTKTKLSQRVHTFETGMSSSDEKKDAAGNLLQASHTHRTPSKVNDRDGTPIEIAAVVVWRIVDTFEAVFHVDNYEEFVHIQSESALRNLASQYPYDQHDDSSWSLRGNTADVADKLKVEIQDRMQKAGVEIIEARISFLAYAPEIAAAMLQRQQAGAVIAARQRIVEGAVGMVEMALDMLSQKKIVELDDERRAAMVSNLMIVLCGDRNAQPVMNTGTLYQ